MDVRVLKSGNAHVLQRVADEVFDDPVNPKFVEEFLNDPRHVIAVAIDAGEVVGFASGVRYLHPDKPSEFWINEVSVAPTHRERGAGKAIMSALLARAEADGCREAWVLTDEDNGPARRLYRAAGGDEGSACLMITFRLGRDQD